MMPQEWREEDEAELRAGLSAVLHRIAAECARKDTTVWPLSVSARMSASMHIPQSTSPTAAADGDATAEETDDDASHVHVEDLLAGLGLSCWYVTGQYASPVTKTVMADLMGSGRGPWHQVHHDNTLD